FRFVPKLQLYDTFGSLLSYYDAHRDANKVRILELDSRPLVAIIQQRLYAGLMKPGSNMERQIHLHLILRRNRNDMNLIRSNRFWPNDPVAICMLLKDGGEQPGYPNSVAAHYERLFLARRIQKFCVQRITVFRSQLKHMANLNTSMER